MSGKRRHGKVPRPTLSQEEQSELWLDIEQEIIRAHPQRFQQFKRIPIRRIAAAIALGVIGMGSLSYAGHYLPFQRINGKNVLHSFAAPTTIADISVEGGNAGPPERWIPIKEEVTAHKLLTWLHDARIVYLFQPRQHNVIRFGGGPTTLDITLPSGRASILTATAGIVEVDEANTITYLHSKPLAHWISSGSWQTEFLPEESRSISQKTYTVIAPQLSGYPVVTPEGIAWFSRSSTVDNPIPHSANTLPTAPYQLYLSPPNSTTLDIRSARQLLTLPLYVNTSGHKLYESAYALHGVGQWLLFSKTYSAIDSTGVPTQSTPNELLVYNMKTARQELVTKFTWSNTASFWYGTYKQYVFFDKRFAGQSAANHVFMYNLKTKRTTKLNISSKDINNVFTQNGMVGSERIMHYRLDSQLVTVHLTRWEL